MTVASQINRIKTNIANTYTALEEKGATLPTVQNSNNLAECVQSVTGGGDDTLIDSIVTRTINYYSSEKVKNVAISAFFYCTSLSAVNIPNATTLGQTAFGYCTSLTSVNFPKVTTSGMNTFSHCTSLKTVDFSNVQTLGTSTLAYCSALTALILRTSSVCTLSSATGVFTNTPIASGTGYIYVPDNLVASYKTATNWSALANQIKPLSQYQS